jgi:hypothetical protein
MGNQNDFMLFCACYCSCNNPLMYLRFEMQIEAVRSFLMRCYM